MCAQLPCKTLISEVVDTGLCTRCGTCVGVCPTGNITIDDPFGECLPGAGDDCNSCGLCLAGCPGKRVEFCKIENEIFGESKRDFLLGVVRKAWIACSRDRSVRDAGASGGVVTALMQDLLKRGEVGGALVYAAGADRHWQGEGAVVRTPEELSRAAQSRYHLSPMNTALSCLAGSECEVVMGGLPCHVHGLRKLENAGWKECRKIGPVIGIYCGNNLYFEATRVMLRKLGIKSLDDVKELYYREGDWPGFFSVKLNDGTIRRISKLDFNQAIPFYVNRRCLFCIDLTNEFTDISVGDGWSREGSGDGGWSIVLARTARGVEIVERAASDGIVDVEEISIEEARDMHSHAFDLKKTGAFLRIGSWKRLGFKVPEYDIVPGQPKIGRRIAEILISAQFILSSTVAGRLIFRLIPASVLGPLFRTARKAWIKITRK